MEKVKFISYDGKYPNLCSGTLVLEIDGKEHSFEYALISGGGVYFDSDWNENVTRGEWCVNLPDEFKHLKNIVEELVNDNVEYGCCGGCV